MTGSTVARTLFLLLSALVHVAHNLDYGDLERVGKTCPSRDKCAGYRNDRTYIDRACECDSQCETYGDCCIDVRRRGSSSSRSPSRNGIECIPYGEVNQAGVYVITRCSSNWNGPAEVRQKCEASEVDFSDPLAAAPVTSSSRSKTYRNWHCAECNNADMSSLTSFLLRVRCNGLQDMSQEELFNDITYDGNLKIWGVNRLNPSSNDMQFHHCRIIFDVPSYLNDSVRFCRSNLTSSCPSTWTRHTVKRNCAAYMAVVFDRERAYRNPHCAICNGKTVDQLHCTSRRTGSKESAMLALFDLNRNTSGNCAPNEKRDPFIKRCSRRVTCLPGRCS